MSRWYEKAGTDWNDEDCAMASAFLKEHQAGILQPDPFGVVHTAVFDAALARYRGGWRYKAADTPHAFLDHVSLHLGTLKRILIRDAPRPPDMSAAALVEASCAALEEWLHSDPAPKRRLTGIVGRDGHDRTDTGRLIVLFARARLRRIVEKVDANGFSGWDYLARSFKRFVVRQRKKERVDRRLKTVSMSDFDRADPSPNPEALTNRLSEEALNRRRVAAVRAIVRRWELEETRKDHHPNSLDPACGGCRPILVAQCHAHSLLGDEPDGEQRTHLQIASELRISDVHARVLWHRVRHKLNEAVERTPSRLTSDGGGREWLVHLNDYALWDTEVAIECEPRDIAAADVATIRIPAGVATSLEHVVLHPKSSATTRVAAVEFDRHGKPGDTVPCQIRFDQVRLRATVKGGAISEWVAVPPDTMAWAPTGVQLTASGPAKCVIADVSTPLPATLTLSAGETTLHTRIVVPAGPPQLARIDAHPNPAIGGDPVTLTLRLGLLLTAEASGRSATGLLAIKSSRAVALELTSASTDIHFDDSTRLSRGPTLTVQAHTKPVSRPESAEVVVRSSGRDVRTQMNLIPPPPASIAVHNVASTVAVRNIAAGATVDVVVGFGSPVPIDTDVHVLASHSGLTIEQPHTVVRKGARHARFVVRADDDAKSGRARLTARANGAELSLAVAVDKNVLESLEFEDTEVVGGAKTTATISSRHPVGADVLLDVSSSDGALLQLSGTGHTDGQSTSPIRIPRGSTSVTFHVLTRGVTKPHRVSLTVNGFGETISGVLTLKPRPQPRMDEHE